jgi:hypothetical protein
MNRAISPAALHADMGDGISHVLTFVLKGKTDKTDDMFTMQNYLPGLLKA